MVKKKKQPKKAPSVTFREATMVSIGNIVPNSYNPNKMSPPKYAAFCAHVDEVGFMHPIAVTQADRNGIYTIIDGEHRLRYLKDRGVKGDIPVIVMPKNYDGFNVESTLASLRFNLHGENDGIQLGEVYHNVLDNGYSAQTLAESLGESVSDVERIAEIIGANYEEQESAPEDPPDSDKNDPDSFVEITLTFSKEAWESVVEPEIRRVMRVAGIHHNTDETIEFGQAVELIAALSSQTPEESIG